MCKKGSAPAYWCPGTVNWDGLQAREIEIEEGGSNWKRKEEVVTICQETEKDEIGR